MPPETAATIQAIAAILERLGSLPIGAGLILWSLAPWVIMISVSYRNEKRFEAVVRMYEDNVKLVTSYEECCKGYRDLATFTVEKVSHLTTIAENNMFCPIVRKETRQREVDR